MHPESSHTLALKRALFVATMIALAFFGNSCDRDTPMEATPLQESLTGGGTNTGTTTYSARATGARTAVLGSTVGLCSAGPLPPGGGEDGRVLLAGRVQGVVAASAFHSVAFGYGDRSGASSTSADLDVRVGGQHILACLAMSFAEAKCVAGNVVIRGESQIADLRINGQTYLVTGQPNQTIWLPLGTGRIVINEQIRGSGSLTVRALRVAVAGAAEVVVGETQAGISCGQPVCNGSKDFVTGGGWITGTPTGSKATFGVSGGIKNGSLWGHLAYVDHGPNMRVKGTGVTSYSVVTSTSRHIEGTCEINGQAGYSYRLDVADNGEPGRSDTFRIQLSNGYFASGTLEGGNIQLHTPCK
jgi:hypothetical protein